MASFSGLRNLFRSSPKTKSAKLTKKSAAEKSEVDQQTQANKQNMNTTQRRNDSVELNQQHSIYGNHDASKSAPDLGERKYGSSFEERLNRRNSESTFKSTPLDDKPRFGSSFERRLNQQEGKRTEEDREAYEKKINSRKERTDADRKAYEEKINAQQQIAASKNTESFPKLEPQKYKPYRPDNTQTRQTGHEANSEPLQMPESKDFQYKAYEGSYKQADSVKNDTGSLYSHSNSSKDSGFDEPINYGTSNSHSSVKDEPVTLSSNGAFARDDHFDNFGGYSAQQKTSNTMEHQQQSLYQHKNDSSVSVSSHHGDSSTYKGQSSQSLQYKAYGHQQSDRIYDYSSKHETSIGKKDHDPYSQTHTQEPVKKQDEWEQQGYGNNAQTHYGEKDPYNINSSYGKQSNHGYQQLQMQNSNFRKQQSWQSGHDPMYATGKKSYSNNTHQGAFETKTMQPIREDQALTHFTPPPIKHEPVIKNNTEFHEPEGFAANNGMVLKNRDSSGMTFQHNGQSEKIVVNNKEYAPGSSFDVNNGETVQVGNTLYKLNHEQKMVPVSQDAELVRELYPKGINNIDSRQGQIGDCAKMAQMHSLMTDPSGVGTKALLDTVKRHPSGQGYQVTTGTGYTTHIRTVKDDSGNVHVLGKKPDEAQGATGDPGFQVLERAHYRQVRNERFGRDEVTYQDHNGMLQRSNTLAKRNTDLDANWSSDYATKLVGNNGNFKSFTFDGTEVPAKQMSYLEKLKLKRSEPNMSEADWQALQKQRWQNKTTFEDRMNDPAQAAKINQFFADVKADPSKFRGVAVSRYTDGNDTVKLKLSGGREIYGNHAYSFQGFKQENGKEVVSLSNPHNAGEELNIPPADFMKNFSMFDGLMRAS